MPNFGFAVVALRPTLMTPVEAPFLLHPAKTPAAGPQQSGVIIAHRYGLNGTAFEQAE